MGIHIYNVTPLWALEDKEHIYEILINNECIASFIHVRSDGLAECLRKAAEAVRRREDEKS